MYAGHLSAAVCAPTIRGPTKNKRIRNKRTSFCDRQASFLFRLMWTCECSKSNVGKDPLSLAPGKSSQISEKSPRGHLSERSKKCRFGRSKRRVAVAPLFVCRQFFIRRKTHVVGYENKIDQHAAFGSQSSCRDQGNRDSPRNSYSNAVGRQHTHTPA